MFQVPENDITYRLDTGRSTTDYFSIEPYTGQITVKQRVSADPARPPFYTVRLSINKCWKLSEYVVCVILGNVSQV